MYYNKPLIQYYPYTIAFIGFLHLKVASALKFSMKGVSKFMNLSKDAISP